MRNEKDLIQILINNYKKYPQMQIEDFYKLIYQNEFAGGHLIDDAEGSYKYLKEEFSSLNKHDKSNSIFEDIGNGLVRIYLNSLSDTAISLSTVNKFFVNTANFVMGSKENFEEKLNIFLKCCREGILPYDIKKASYFLDEQKRKGYMHISHSEEYRKAYQPSYRVIKKEYAKYFDIFLIIDEKCKRDEFVYAAIDGRCASGKSTLAEMISGVYDCNIFHTDDFFLPSELRIKTRLEEAGGNIDYDRFENEVIKGLKSKKAFKYQIYDCSKSSLTTFINVEPKKINIIEGAYSMHPKFSDIYQLKIFLHVDKEEQSRRLLSRNGEEIHKRFIKEWIPMEEKYFKEFNIKEKCDLVLKN
ncbi:MAG: hypothetical protein GYA50_08855 [Eubacteriaceae bacterium]|nr:hypothetical protein [Eubacteriaceae bacterium]